MFEAAILIPAYSHRQGLERTLECLLLQTRVKGVQLVLLDDSEGDEVHRLFRDFETRTALHTKYIRRQHREEYRFASACNILWRSADVDSGVLILSNSHVLMRDNWVEQHLNYHEGRDDICVIGPHRDGDWEGLSSARLWNDPGREAYQMLRCYSDSLRKKWLEAVGGWDEDFDGQWGWSDVDLAYRLQRAGVRFARGPGAEVVHLMHEAWQTDRGNKGLFLERHPELRDKYG